MTVLNYPGPWEVRLYYNDQGITHVARYNCIVDNDPAPGADFNDVSVTQRNGASVYLDVAIDAWVVLVKALYPNATANIQYAELWKYTPGTFVATYWSTYDISVAGTSGSGSNGTNQSILSFRTQEGGTMKVMFMSCVLTVGARQAYTGLGAAHKAVVDFIVSGLNWILARDTSYPIAFVYHSPGQNEALFKKIYRP